MNTDILCEVQFSDEQNEQAAADLAEAFDMMREFEKRYSRFQIDNDLYRFNHGTSVVLSPEFFDLLTRAQHFYRFTDGLFDPSILPALEKVGYSGAPHALVEKKGYFSALILDPLSLTATKPANLFIDLGGIGKGYIVDRVTNFLAKNFVNCLVDAGGDIAVRGTNQKEGYAYWAIDVEHPNNTTSTPLLLLSNMSVATSGRTRRHWIKNGIEQHHLIDPRTNESARPDYQSVTVIASDTVTADVLAKTLFIAGKTAAPKLAETWKIPAIFIENDGTVVINSLAEPYVWKTH